MKSKTPTANRDCLHWAIAENYLPNKRGLRRKGRIHLRKQGFSLVELLVVITVISVLAGLLLPVLEQALEAARRTACANNQRQIYLAFALYADGFDTNLPPGSACNMLSVGFEVGPYLNEAYNVTRKLALCPSQKYTRIGGGAADALYHQFAYRACWPDVQTGITNRGVSLMNYAYWGGSTAFTDDPAYEWHTWTTRWGCLPLRNQGIVPTITNVFYPQTIPRRPLLWDQAWLPGSHGNSWQGAAPVGNHSPGRDLGADGSNMIYADGHLKWEMDFSVRFAGSVYAGYHYYSGE